MSLSFGLALMFCLASTVSSSDINSDPISQYNATGKEVVDAALRRLEESCLLGTDYQFFRRLAWVETQFGQDEKAMRNKNNGGIWFEDVTNFAKGVDINDPYVADMMNNLTEQLDLNMTEIVKNPKNLSPIESLAVARLRFPGIYPTVKEQSEEWESSRRKKVPLKDFQLLVSKMPRLCDTPTADIVLMVENNQIAPMTRKTIITSFTDAVKRDLEAKWLRVGIIDADDLHGGKFKRVELTSDRAWLNAVSEDTYNEQRQDQNLYSLDEAMKGIESVYSTRSPQNDSGRVGVKKIAIIITSLDNAYRIPDLVYKMTASNFELFALAYNEGGPRTQKHYYSVRSSKQACDLSPKPPVSFPCCTHFGILFPTVVNTMNAIVESIIDSVCRQQSTFGAPALQRKY